VCLTGPRVKYFQAIAALSLNRVIGRGRQLPWHLPEDFQWFKAKTLGQIVVMGRTTFESLGNPLPGRETILVSASGVTCPGVRTVRALDEIDPAHESRDVFICGGARLYAEALPRCSDLYLTWVKAEVPGDVCFPPFEDRFEAVQKLRDCAEFTIVHYRNPWLARNPRFS
jgi:dihydrofolate reductase